MGAREDLNRVPHPSGFVGEHTRPSKGDGDSCRVLGREVVVHFPPELCRMTEGMEISVLGGWRQRRGRGDGQLGSG